jgi:hypothetical protein
MKHFDKQRGTTKTEGGHQGTIKNKKNFTAKRTLGL